MFLFKVLIYMNENSKDVSLINLSYKSNQYTSLHCIEVQPVFNYRQCHYMVTT